MASQSYAGLTGCIFTSTRLSTRLKTHFAGRRSLLVTRLPEQGLFLLSSVWLGSAAAGEQLVRTVSHRNLLACVINGSYTDAMD